VNADLDSISKAAGIATVFIDEKLQITRFSPDAMQLFKLRDTDLGRRLDDIQHVLNYPDLMANLENTLLSNRMIEREISTLDGKNVYLARLMPYLIPSTQLKGVVTTFVDVTAFHDARRLQTVIDGLPEHIAVLDPTGKIVLINNAWKRFALANGDPELKRSGIGASYIDVCLPGNDDDGTAEDALRGLRGVLGGVLPSFSLEYPCHSPTEQRWFVMNVEPLHSDEFGAVVSHVNISHWYSKQ
jgi:two-component system CheB/CheR fusion protein